MLDKELSNLISEGNQALIKKQKFESIINDSTKLPKRLNTKTYKYQLLKTGLDTYEKFENEYNLIQNKSSLLGATSRAIITTLYESL